jgi:hypothetical protein
MNAVETRRARRAMLCPAALIALLAAGRTDSTLASLGANAALDARRSF